MAIAPEWTGTRVVRISFGITGVEIVTASPGPAVRATFSGAGACGVKVSSQGGALPPPRRLPMQAVRLNASAIGAAKRNVRLIAFSPACNRAVFQDPEHRPLPRLQVVRRNPLMTWTTREGREP